MLYYLFEWLDKFNFPGAGLFQYISFRAAAAIILSLMITMIFGKKIITMLRKKQIGETIRDLGLTGQVEKKERQQWVESLLLQPFLFPFYSFAKSIMSIYYL